MTFSLLQKMDDRLDRAKDFESIVDLHKALTMIVTDNILAHENGRHRER
jgi:hypothetical protein